MPFSGVPWRAVRCGCGRCCAVLCRAGTWKPSYVIDEDKKRANLVWHILLASIVGVFIWKAVSVIIKYHNPDTSFTVSDDVYPFPYMEVCFLESNGCDANISNCLQTEFHWVRDSCYTEVDVQIPSPEESWRCVTFDLGKLDYEKNECLLDTQRPFVEFEMFWIPTVDAAAEGEYK